MTTWKPETIAAARVMYEAGSLEFRYEPVETNNPRVLSSLRAIPLTWDDLWEERQDYYARAFAASLDAMTVSDGMVHAMMVEDRTADYETIDRGSYARLFAAALRYLTTPDAGDAKGEA